MKTAKTYLGPCQTIILFLQKKPFSWMFDTVVTQPAITCSKSAIETLEQRVKHVQS